MKQPRIHISGPILTDAIICVATWIIFYYLRTLIYDYGFRIPAGFYLGLSLYTIGWLTLHFLAGAYQPLYLQSKFAEILRTISTSLIGCLALLFFFILKNPHENNNTYYLEFISLLIPNLLLFAIARWSWLHKAKKQLQCGSVFFNAMIVGNADEAKRFIHSFQQSKENQGYQIAAFVAVDATENKNTIFSVPVWSGMQAIGAVINELAIEEVIITVDKKNRGLITELLQQLSDKEVNVKITPDRVDIISGALHTSNVLGVPLIDIHSGVLPSWQQNLKRLLDLFLSLLMLLVLSPLLLIAAIRVRLSSKGPIFYSQERIGYKGKSFMMYKFRSMYVDAEQHGPQLSYAGDHRVTPWGKIMRRWRMDELPQLWNVLKGEMSLVGPRPERKYYIDQIVKLHPEYKYLLKVKPGITSWGMVNYGYASTIDQMIERMPYDLLYVENIGLALDIKILFYTIQFVFAGKEKQ